MDNYVFFYFPVIGNGKNSQVIVVFRNAFNPVNPQALPIGVIDKRADGKIVSKIGVGGMFAIKQVIFFFRFVVDRILNL